MLLVVAWLGSGWYCLMWELPASGYICIQAGQFSVAEPLWAGDSRGLGVLWFEPLDTKFEWWFRWGRWNGGRDVAAPLWLPTLAVALITIGVWRADARARRRQRNGCCATCNYDRAGLPPAAPCPECGAGAATSMERVKAMRVG